MHDEPFGVAVLVFFHFVQAPGTRIFMHSSRTYRIFMHASVLSVFLRHFKFFFLRSSSSSFDAHMAFPMQA